jgi:NADP-dependent 3-hydroxy acid dehydrogenase YdfG
VALAKAFQSSFTLLGRSALLAEEPAWAYEIKTDADLKQSVLKHFKSEDKKISPKDMNKMIREVLSSREIHSTLARIKNAGGEAHYLQVDITDSEDLINKLEPHKKEITGLLHGAGALADKYIEDKKESDFELVYGVKVDGLKNILSLISPEQLDHLVLFSSVAGFYGNIGQADYSLSNEVLNKIAHHLKQTYPSTQVLVIDWGPWDGGMVTPQLKRILTKKKVQVISLTEGTETLVNLLKKPINQIQWVVGNPMPFPPAKVSGDLQSYRIYRVLSLEANPFLADHVIGGKAVLPTVCAVAWFINNCEKLYPGFNFFSVQNYQVFKGIIFDDTLADEYLLELKEIQKSSESIIFEGRISSESAQGKLRNHYQAQVELRIKIPPQPQMDGFDLSLIKSGDKKNLYEEKTLFHGPRFRGVQEVMQISPAGLTTRCFLPSFPRREQGQFPAGSFNPFIADVHLQSLLIWASSQMDSIGLPLQISGGTQYRAVDFDTTSYVTMQVQSNTNHKLVADVISHDEVGKIYSYIEAAEITLNNRLFDLFKENKLEKEPLWQ